MSFAILGHGRFGQALAALLREAGHAVRAWDPHADVPPDYVADSIDAALEGASWVVLAMPVPQMDAALRALRPRLRSEHTVIDVGSVKMHPCALMDELLGDDIAHAGTHPLFGPLSLARGERPLRTVVCASPRHPDAAARTRQLFAGLGCEVIEQAPAVHDRAMAHTHALAFFIAKGLVDIGVDDELTVAPPSFQGLKNMLAAVRGDAGHLFAAIQQENPFAEEARAQLIDALQGIHRRLLAPGEDAALTIAER
ncbi:prephenate dehydrogenase/arogenate dehydrogenase family protein [Dyella sp. KRB-257]|uniref:prephenate dehydrogenase/arogenate dehydrogenase family protein n=1 Tax=Dyella sp. KRB-257 TaxID=3400915 RepID=UPI003BFE050B